MTRILFIDRDGVLIEEPADEQIDSYEKFRLVAGVIPALLRLRDAGFEFVMVTNQNGLGDRRVPAGLVFEGPHRLLLQILDSQGIRFKGDPDRREPSRGEQADLASRASGMVMHYLRDRSIDLVRERHGGRSRGPTCSLPPRISGCGVSS